MEQIWTIAVIGAGLRGRAIAHAALRGGFRVVLEDVSTVALSDAREWLKSAAEALVVDNLATASSVEAAIREADMVVEAAAEEIEVKTELFTIFDKFAKPNAILATSSPSLPVQEMASVTFCADRCIGMSFSGGAASHVITLTAGPETSQDTVARCEKMARRMGQQVIVRHESTIGNEIPTLRSATVKN